MFVTIFVMPMRGRKPITAHLAGSAACKEDMAAQCMAEPRPQILFCLQHLLPSARNNNTDGADAVLHTVHDQRTG